MDEEFNLVVGQHKRIYGALVGDLNRSHVSVWVCVTTVIVCVFFSASCVTLKGLSLLGEEIKSWVVASMQQQQTNSLMRLSFKT